MSCVSESVVSMFYSVVYEPFLFSCLAGCTDTVLLSVATYAAMIFVPYSFGMQCCSNNISSRSCVCVCVCVEMCARLRSIEIIGAKVL